MTSKKSLISGVLVASVLLFSGSSFAVPALPQCTQDQINACKNQCVDEYQKDLCFINCKATAKCA